MSRTAQDSSVDSDLSFSVESLPQSDGSYANIRLSDDSSLGYDSLLTPSPTPSFPTGLGDDSYFSQSSQRPGHSDDGQSLSSSPSRSFLSQSSQSKASQYANDSLVPPTQFDFPDPLAAASSSPPSPALSQSLANPTYDGGDDTSSISSIASGRLTPAESLADTGVKTEADSSNNPTSNPSSARLRELLSEYSASDSYISERFGAIAKNTNLSASASYQVRRQLASYQTLSDRSDAHSHFAQNSTSAAPYLAPESARSEYDSRFNELRSSISALTDPSIGVLSRCSLGLSSRKEAMRAWEERQSKLVTEADSALSRLASARRSILEEISHLDALISDQHKQGG